MKLGNINVSTQWLSNKEGRNGGEWNAWKNVTRIFEKKYMEKGLQGKTTHIHSYMDYYNQTQG